MPFSLGSKIALKSTGNLTPSDTKYYGFTNIESHEDLTDPNAPLYYIADVDDWDGAAPGASDDRVQLIRKTDIIDLYVIGEGETGACWSRPDYCQEECYPVGGDGVLCCGANCQGNNTCQCNVDVVFRCCGEGIYATGGYGIPYHIRINTSGIDEDKWATGTSAILQIQQFTGELGPVGPSDIDRAIVIKVIKDTYEFGRVSITDSRTIQGGVLTETQLCAESLVCPGTPRCSCASQLIDFGSSVNSIVNVISNYGISITSTAYGDPVSDGTLENIFYTNFGWSGLTGITWNNYGTGGSGCYYTEQTGDLTPGCVEEYPKGSGAPGRILGVAINAPFEP